ncbi:Carbamoyl-phosphate synthase large chain [subsurface metagenome]
MIKNGQLHLIINTPLGKITKKDETSIRSTAILYKVPLVTTIAGAEATVSGIEALIKKGMSVKCLQEYHKLVKH